VLGVLLLLAGDLLAGCLAARATEYPPFALAAALASCRPAGLASLMIDGYVVEGHVSAATVKRREHQKPWEVGSLGE
jgi:hypothetical protein